MITDQFENKTHLVEFVHSLLNIRNNQKHNVINIMTIYKKQYSSHFSPYVVRYSATRNQTCKFD